VKFRRGQKKELAELDSNTPQKIASARLRWKLNRESADDFEKETITARANHPRTAKTSSSRWKRRRNKFVPQNNFGKLARREDLNL